MDTDSVVLLKPGFASQLISKGGNSWSCHITLEPQYVRRILNGSFWVLDCPGICRGDMILVCFAPLLRFQDVYTGSWKIKAQEPGFQDCLAFSNSVSKSDEPTHCFMSLSRVPTLVNMERKWPSDQTFTILCGFVFLHYSPSHGIILNLLSVLNVFLHIFDE